MEVKFLLSYSDFYFFKFYWEFYCVYLMVVFLREIFFYLEGVLFLYIFLGGWRVKGGVNCGVVIIVEDIVMMVVLLFCS